MAIKLPFKPSRAAQATVAFLAALGATGTAFLHNFAGFLSPHWAATITAALAVVAAVAGFIQDAEPIIGELDQ